MFSCVTDRQTDGLRTDGRDILHMHIRDAVKIAISDNYIASALK